MADPRYLPSDPRNPKRPSGELPLQPLPVGGETQPPSAHEVGDASHTGAATTDSGFDTNPSAERTTYSFTKPRPPEADFIAERLAEGDTVDDVARLLDKSPSTVKRMIRDHRLRAEADELRAASLRRTARRLAKASDQAVDTLVGELESDNPTTKMAAADRLLSQNLRYAKAGGDQQSPEQTSELHAIYVEAFSVFMQILENMVPRETFREYCETIYRHPYLAQLSAELKYWAGDGLPQTDV